ncbi:MAG TPA: hypothetical protein VE201_00515, partial [Nitrospirales bacterium]|nr:hypothetical protein [Nitrospirales bacterium]
YWRPSRPSFMPQASAYVKKPDSWRHLLEESDETPSPGSTASLHGAGVDARGGGVTLQPASMSSASAAPGMLEHGEVMGSTAKVSPRLRFENGRQKAIAAYLVNCLVPASAPPGA